MNKRIFKKQISKKVKRGDPKTYDVWFQYDHPNLIGNWIEGVYLCGEIEKIINYDIVNGNPEINKIIDELKLGEKVTLNINVITKENKKIQCFGFMWKSTHRDGITERPRGFIVKKDDYEFIKHAYKCQNEIKVTI